MNKRLFTLFKLLNESNTNISSKSLSNELRVSERTIRTDISTLNDTLKENGSIIKIKKGSGYYIEITDLSKYQEFLANLTDDVIESGEIPDSPIERNQYILKYLLYNNSYIKLENLADSLYVSKVTILNDIKRIKPILSEYNLVLVSKPHYGVKIEGKEIDIRRCISNNIINRDFESYIIGITNKEKELFNKINLVELQEIVRLEINKSKIEFLDFNLKNFIIHLAITISRLMDNYTLDGVSDIVITDFNSNSAIENIFKYIENTYNLTLSKGDKVYIYNHFVSKSLPLDNHIGASDSKIVEYVEELLDEINNLYNFDLRDDETLYKALVLHFKSILNSKYYNLNKVNPLINTIKSNYPLAFEITLNAVEKVFKKSIYTLTEDEIGYVALHIGASIEGFFQNNVKRKNVVLVCGSGYGSSRLLEVQINKIFRDKINIINCLSFNQYSAMKLSDIDLIISTIPLTHKSIPVIIVDLTLLKHDIETISKALTNESNTYNNVIDNFYDKDLFFINPVVDNKEDLLNLMCSKLHENNLVFPTFTESVFYRESLSSTNLDNFLAIPHPMELSSNKTKICCAILKEPIVWNKDSSVRMVMMLAINKDDYTNMDSIYDIFIKLINEEGAQDKLTSCSSFEDFISVLKSFV